MSRSPTYVDACLGGYALLDDVDDWVESWHGAEGAPRGFREPLEAYLGFNDFEYSAWAEKPSLLRAIVGARKRMCSIEDAMSAQKYALAARSSDPSEAKNLVQWLKSSGRLSLDDLG